MSTSIKMLRDFISPLILFPSILEYHRYDDYDNYEYEFKTKFKANIEAM